MKKILSLILVLVMLAGLCVCGFAQENEGNYIVLEFSDMKYDANQTDNNIWFSIELVGEYEDCSRICLKFDYDESVLKSGWYADDGTSDYILRWSESDLNILSSFSDDVSDKRFYSGFTALGSGVHDLSVQAVMHYKDFSKNEQNIEVVINGLSEEVADATTYGSKVTFPEVMYFDAQSNGNEANTFSVDVSARDIALYEYACVEVAFNPEVLEYETSCFTEDVLYSKDFTTTENSVCFKATFNDIYHDRDNSIFANESGSATHIFKIKGTGNPDISVSAYAVDLNGDRVELTVDLNDFYGEVLDKSELKFLEGTNAFDYISSDIFILNRTMPTKDIFRYFSSTCKVIDKDGIELMSQDNIPTGAKIVTLYQNRYIIDEQQIIVLGDVNCDGNVTAADARKILRISSDLEFTTEHWFSYEAADCDGKNGITASDARLALRVAAGIDSFAAHVIEMNVGESIEISPLKNAGSGSYNWACTVSQEKGLTVVDEINPPENVEIKPGTPFEWTFTVTADEAGMYTLHFELVRSWNEEVADEFDITVIVND